MAKAQTTLELRPAIIADGEKVADLGTAWTPDDPRDPEMLHFRWTFPPAGEGFTRMMAERDEAAIAFLYAGHIPWGNTPQRFGSLPFPPHPKNRSETHAPHLVRAWEGRLRAD